LGRRSHGRELWRGFTTIGHRRHPGHAQPSLAREAWIGFDLDHIPTIPSYHADVITDPLVFLTSSAFIWLGAAACRPD
jgi:hypothetical protein